MDKRISKRSSESGNEDFPISERLKMAGESTEEDTGVGANSGFGISLSFGEEAEEIVI
jgi:hypothetical protein